MADTFPQVSEDLHLVRISVTLDYSLVGAFLQLPFFLPRAAHE